MLSRKTWNKSTWLSKLRVAEAVFFLTGTFALGYCVFTRYEVRAARQTAANLEINTHTEEAAAHAGDVIGSMRISALKLSVPITQGIEVGALVRGVGHVPGTAVPGGLGTMGLAGHRDTFFRPLRRVAPGMSIEVSGTTGTYQYMVDSTEIVMPDQVRVLDIGSRPELVLVTCYPFDFIGAAPKRFIVHAHLLSVLSDDASR